MNTTIRKALTSDLEAIQALARSNILTSYRPFLGDEAVEAFTGSGASDDYLAESLPYTWVQVRDEWDQEDIIVGIAVCRENQIELMMVARDLHRQGLGSALLAYCEGAMFLGNPELTLESFAPNEAANAFYRKSGWLEQRRYHDADAGVDKLELRKSRAA